MSVTKEITRLEKSNVKLSLTVPKEETLAQYQDLLKDYAKNMQIPGFRKGKVPQDVLVRKFGEALKGEALGKIIEKAVGEVFDDESLPVDERPLAYSQPELQGEPKLDFDQDLQFSVVYDVMPKVSIGQWKGLEVEVPEAAVTDEDIARELEEVRERNSIVLDRDEGAEARNGDVVTVDYDELDDNGEAIPNGGRKDFAFTLGSKTNVYQFDDDIVGMKKGETKEITKTHEEHTHKLRITLNSLKEKKLPDLDDDLAQDVDEKFNTLDDLKNSIRTRLEKSLNLRVRDLKINKLLEKIMENTPVTLPESMVRVEVDGRLRNMAQRFGTDVDTLFNMMGQSGDGPDAIYAKWRVSAEKGLHSRLIVETIMEEQHIEVSDADIEQEKAKIAADTNRPVEEIQKQFEEARSLEYLKETIMETKLYDLLLAENTVKNGPKTSYLDLMAKNE